MSSLQKIEVINSHWKETIYMRIELKLGLFMLPLQILSIGLKLSEVTRSQVTYLLPNLPGFTINTYAKGCECWFFECRAHQLF